MGVSTHILCRCAENKNWLCFRRLFKRGTSFVSRVWSSGVDCDMVRQGSFPEDTLEMTLLRAEI